jgi:hypothetical protein
MSKPFSYYQGLITSEYKNSVKFNAWITANLKYLDNNSQITDMLDAVFDIDAAIGVQLDALGVILGRSRTLTFQPSDGVSPVLEDNYYRLVLKAKILINHWDGLLQSISPQWSILFPNSVFIVRDNQDMSMDIIISATTPLERDLLEHAYIVPKPQGVLINYYFGTEPFFGYDLETSSISGYEEGQ